MPSIWENKHSRENKMNLIEWVTLAAVCFMGAATPGPSLAIIVNHTLKSGKVAGQIAAFTHAFAIVFYAIATIYGLASLFERYPNVAKIVTYLGVAYLLYLAFKLFKSSFNRETKPSASLDAKEAGLITHGNKGYSNAAIDAFMIAFLNPKLAFFFVALFSQFIPVDGTTLEMTLILTSTVFFIDFIWYLLVVAIVSHGQSKLNVSPNMGIWFARLQAAIFVAISINTILWR